MLGTPPAFVLSQDQTLYKLLLVNPSELTLTQIHKQALAHFKSVLLKLIDFTVRKILREPLLVAI